MNAADLIAKARPLIEPLTGHTEGEWCADLSETYSVRERDGARIASCSHLNKLGRRSNDEAAANCRLSAAAPVMRDTIEALLDDRDALMQRLEALMSFSRPFADALDIECDFMTPPAPFEDGFDVRARARAALQADEVAQ